MKKIILTTLLFVASTTSSIAEVHPFIGVSVNPFSIAGKNFTATDANGNIIYSASDKSNDRGVATGIVGGLLITDNVKLNLSYYSGKENDSSLMTATVTSVSIDYSFNGSGIHKGWFLGGGLSNVEIETKKIPSTTLAQTSSASGLLARGGYEYKFDNNLFLEMALNIHFAEVKQSLKATGILTGTNINSTLSVVNAQVSLSYVF